jgi:hypothetical protein
VKLSAEHKARVRDAVYRQGLSYMRAAEVLELTVGQVAGVAHKTPLRFRGLKSCRRGPYRPRAILTAAS